MSRLLTRPLTRRSILHGACSCSAAAIGWSSPLMAGITDGPVAELTPGYHAIDEDEKGMWMVMDKVEKEIRASEFTVRDPALNAYIHDITCKLAGDFCPDIRTYIIRTPYFNATMAPNGMMQVWTGLLLRMRNEAQLSAILGHEIGHYMMKHSLKTLRSIRNSAGLGMFLRIGLAVATAAAGGGASGGAAAGDLGALLAWAGHFSYSREFEREADHMGLKLMSHAGYNPIAASEVWSQLLEEQNFSLAEEEKASNSKKKKKKKRKKSRRKSNPLFATHPASEERMENLKELAKSEAQLIQSQYYYTERFLENVQSLRAELIEDQLKVGKESESEYLLNQLIAEGNGLGELYFYKGELYRRSRDADRKKDAIKHYEKSLQYGDSPADAYRSFGLIHMKQKNYSEAKEAFENYLQKAAIADDREMINFYLQSMPN